MSNSKLPFDPNKIPEYVQYQILTKGFDEGIKEVYRKDSTPVMDNFFGIVCEVITQFAQTIDGLFGKKGS